MNVYHADDGGKYMTGLREKGKPIVDTIGNYSSVLSRLIVEAGKHCKSYASDLFISWNSLLEKANALDADNGNTEFTEYFGFREMGVDHEPFIKCRLENSGCYGENPYKAIYKVDVKLNRFNDIELRLIKLVVDK